VVQIPRITGPETSLLHRCYELLVRLFGMVSSHLKRNRSKLRIRLVDTPHPAAVSDNRGQRRRLVSILGLGFHAHRAREARNIGVEEGGGLLEVLLVEDLVRPLAVGVLGFRVNISVDGGEELGETELDDAVGDAEASGREAVLRVDGGEGPDGAAAPVVP
jgi:hypothetical protein